MFLEDELRGFERLTPGDLYERVICAYQDPGFDKTGLPLEEDMTHVLFHP